MYLVTAPAKALLDDGYKGNGCGSGFYSHIGCLIISTAVLGMQTVRDLEDAWDIHDAEYSIPDKYKSPRHKEEADSNLHYNIRQIIGKETQFARVIHAILILRGRASYLAEDYN